MAADAVQPRTRRRRWPWVLIIVIVLLGALAVAGEILARSLLPGIVRGIVIEQIDLPADQQLDVSAEGILLPQLILGGLDELHLSSDDVTVGTLSGAAEVTAYGVPLRGGELSSATGTVRIGEEQFQELVATAGLPIDTITLAEPDVTAEGAVRVFGMELPLSLTVTPGAEGGELVLEPKAVSLGGFELTAEELRSRLGGTADQITGAQRICIADRLPEAILLTAVSVRGSEVEASFSVDGDVVAAGGLQRNGSC